MKDDSKPYLRDPPDNFILHVETNDKSSEEPRETIAKTNIDIAVSLKKENHDVSTSNIILQTDNQLLKVNTVKVNRYLAELFAENDFSLIDSSKKFCKVV